MNWLAHVALSNNETEHQLGNLVADVVKGRPWTGISQQAIDGLETHLRIDSFTDANPIVKRSMSRLGATGKLRSVVIDITFDHMLTKNWGTFYDIPLRTFLDQFYLNAKTAIKTYPDDAKSFVESVIERDRLGLYAEPNSILEALYRIDSRLSERLRKRELASSHFEAIKENYEDIEADFLEFYPLLSEHVHS